MECLICDSWNKTPHAKRFTTPIPPQYAEETLVIGFWLGVRFGSNANVMTSLCKRHLALVTDLEKQNQVRTAPTTPPPPRTPAMQEMAMAIQAAEKIRAAAAQSPNIPRNNEGSPGSNPEVIPPNPEPSAAIRQSFAAIAQKCAVEFVKQHPAAQSQPPGPTEDTLRQALASIAEHSTDPDAAQFAARVLDGTALPPVPPPPNPETTATSPAGTFPCPLCNKQVKPGEVHSC